MLPIHLQQTPISIKVASVDLETSTQGRMPMHVPENELHILQLGLGDPSLLVGFVLRLNCFIQSLELCRVLDLGVVSLQFHGRGEQIVFDRKGISCHVNGFDLFKSAQL
jgi:hypothetical protein